MRILYFTDTYPPQVNGVSVVTELTVRGLERRGHVVGVIAPRYPPTEEASVFGDHGSELVLSVPSWPLPRYPDIRFALPDYFGIADATVRFRPDLIHCATEFVLGRLGQIMARRLRVPMITSYHTNFGRYLAAYGAPWLERPTTSYLTRFHNRAAFTLTPSRAAAAYLHRMGVDRTIVWGAGVDPVRFHPRHRRPELRARLGLDRRFTFLHVGRLAPEKNLEVLIDAFRLCRASLGDDRVTLIVAGDGPSRKELEAAAPPGVLFLGFLDRAEDLPQLYAGADGFVFSSETETLGLVLLEAMASGLPVVAAPEAGVTQFLRHGVNGLAYPAGDVRGMARAMTELVEERGLWAALAAGARRTATALSWEVEFDRLERIYRSRGRPAWPPLDYRPGTEETADATAAGPV